MKAVRIENKNYKVVEEKGSFVYYENDVKKVKCINANTAIFVECEESEIHVSKFYKANSTKKLNRANFMSEEEFSKSKYAKMDRNEFDEMRRRDMFASKSM